MNNSIWFCILIAIIVALIFIVRILLKDTDRMLEDFGRQVADLRIYYIKEIDNERKRAIKQSKAVIRGHVSQELVPLFPDFPYDTSDVRHLGGVCDYIVFDKMSELRDNSVSVIEPQISIIFADVKVGTAKASRVQNGLKKALEANRVRWETWNIDSQTKKLTIK